MRDEIQSEADRRWQSECENGGNRKVNDDTPVLVPCSPGHETTELGRKGS